MCSRLRVPMRQHGPESAHRGRRNGNAELGDVALQECPHESVSPNHAVVVLRREVRAGQTATQPKSPPVLGIGLAEAETGQLDELDAAGERLRYASDQSPAKRFPE